MESTYSSIRVFYKPSPQQPLLLVNINNIIFYCEKDELFCPVQGLDIHWRDHYICPTVDEYIDMVLKKTGGLMMLAFDLMYIFRDQSGAVTKSLYIKSSQNVPCIIIHYLHS